MNYLKYWLLHHDLVLDVLDRLGFMYDFHRWRVPSAYGTSRWHYEVRIWR